MKDNLILQKMRAGDPSGLEALMDRYIPYVSTICWNILRGAMTKEDAEEVVSDVFLAAWEQARDIQPGKAKAWLGAVARNKARNKLREMGQELPLEEDYDTLSGMVFSSFDRIPEEGSRPAITLNGLHVQVESICDHRVEKALVSKVLTETSDETDEERSDE